MKSMKKCKHENVRTENQIKEEVWGALEVVEFDEVCEDCGAVSHCAYGSCEEWEGGNE